MVALPYLSEVTVMVYVVVKSPLVGGSSNFHTQLLSESETIDQSLHNNPQFSLVKFHNIVINFASEKFILRWNLLIMDTLGTFPL